MDIFTKLERNLLYRFREGDFKKYYRKNRKTRGSIEPELLTWLNVVLFKGIDSNKKLSEKFDSIKTVMRHFIRIISSIESFI